MGGWTDGWMGEKEEDRDVAVIIWKAWGKKIIIQCRRGSKEADNEVKLMGAGKLLSQGPKRSRDAFTCAAFIRFFCFLLP